MNIQQKELLFYAYENKCLSFVNKLSFGKPNGLETT